jgi:hypothetical protein
MQILHFFLAIGFVMWRGGESCQSRPVSTFGFDSKYPPPSLGWEPMSGVWPFRCHTEHSRILGYYLDCSATPAVAWPPFLCLIWRETLLQLAVTPAACCVFECMRKILNAMCFVMNSAILSGLENKMPQR